MLFAKEKKLHDAPGATGIPDEKIVGHFHTKRATGDLLRDRFVKVATILGFVAIILVNIITLLNPTHGYELSIYDATPSLIWYSLIFSSLCGISVIVFEVYTKHYDISNSWVYGLVIVLISRVTILCLPYNRGYIAWQGDHMNHIGIVHDILTSGSVASDNYYPVAHILLSEVALTSNLSAEFLTKYSTVFMSVFFVISIYLIGEYLLNDKKVTLLALAATGCVMFGSYDVYLMPNGWSVLFFPFALLLIIKATDREVELSYRILATVILIASPFFHTLSALMLTVVLLLFAAIYTFLSKFEHLRDKIQEHFVLPDSAPSFTLICILLVTWIMWTLSFQTFHLNIRVLFDSVFSGADEDVLAGMGNQISTMNFNIFDLALLVVKVEGVAISFLILFVLGSCLVYTSYRKKQEFRRVIIFIGVALFFGFLYTIYLFGILPGLGSIDGSRIVEYVKVMTPIFAGIVYAYILSKKKMVCLLLCITIMIIPVVLAIFGIFASPYVHRPTPQITTMDIYGMEWSFVKKDRETRYVEIMSPPSHFADVVLGRDESAQRSDIPRRGTERIPNHFNYLERTYFGENYPSDKYLVLTMFDRVLYTTVYMPVGRFNDADFMRLKSDYSVQYLYSNGECEVYHIRAIFDRV